MMPDRPKGLLNPVRLSLSLAFPCLVKTNLVDDGDITHIFCYSDN